MLINSPTLLLMSRIGSRFHPLKKWRISFGVLSTLEKKLEYVSIIIGFDFDTVAAIEKKKS